MIDPEVERFGDDGNKHEGNGVEDPSIGVLVGHGPELRRDPQTQLVCREFLCERLDKMKPPSFEGSTNPLDTEEWLSSIETILDFMELDDRE